MTPLISCRGLIRGTALFVAAGVVLASSLAANVEAASQPNVVIVMSDDVGYGDYACLGNPIIHTPAADAFYKQSLRFTDFHVSPTCSPTRASLMTGRHEFRNGVTHTILERERLTLKATTLGQVLKSAGYTTGIFGKWHLGDEAPYQPDQRGFVEVFIHGAGGIGQTYPGSCGDAPGNTYFNPALLHNGKFEKTQGYCTDLFFGQAIRWMDQQRKGSGARPFFAYIPLNAAHSPHQVPDEYYNRYKGKVPDETARFFGMIENIDDNFAVLLKKLKEWGLEENTLVIFLTDNGGTNGTKVYNAGMRGSKNSPYQGGTRVPCFWRWPAAIRGGVDCDALTAHIDVFPTLAEIAGAKLGDHLKQQVEGRSLLPLLHDPTADWPERYLVTHCGRWDWGQARQSKYAGCSIRNGRFTLVENRELYDLKNDPGETTNVIDQHPQVVADLRQAYDQWWSEVLPAMVNEQTVGPKINPFKERYWKQFGGGPDEASLQRISPISKDPGRSGPAKKGRQAGATAAAGAAKPNVVILLADDLRPDALGALGHPLVKTPNLDRLIQGGLVFRSAYVMGSMQGAVCLPSRTMLLTGQSLFRAQNAPSGATPEKFTFPRAMREAGYATVHAGKFGNSPRAVTREFDESSDPGQATAVADAVIDFIRRKAGQAPLFVYMAGKEPHDPQYATDRFYAMYPAAGIPLPAAFAAYHPFDNGEMTVRDEKTLPWPRTKEDLSAKLARYYASISYWDSEVGRVLKALEAQGQFENTIFVIAGDNGLSLGEHGLLGKQNLYEFGGMHVPLVFAGKGVPKGETHALAYLMDVFPTICDLTATPKPGRVEGLSLAPVIRGQQAGVRDWMFTAYGKCQRAVSDGRWKLIRYPLIDKTQLFELPSDPHEQNDLAGKADCAEKVAELMGKLAELQRQWADEHPLTVDKPLPAEWSPARLTKQDVESQKQETAVSSGKKPRQAGGGTKKAPQKQRAKSRPGQPR